MTASMAEMVAEAVTAVIAKVKQAVFLLIALVLLASLPVLAGCEANASSDVSKASEYELPSKPTGPSRYVQDLAGILTPEEEKKLVDLSTQVEKDTTAEMLFITVEVSDPDNLRSLADRVLHEWGVGKAETDNGVVIAVAAKPGDFTSINGGTRKRKYAISTGYGTEGYLTDLKAKDIAEEQMVPMFQKNMWGEGLYAGGNAVAALFYAEKAGTSMPSAVNQADPVMGEVEENTSNSTGIIFSVALIGFFVLIFGMWLGFPLLSRSKEEEAEERMLTPTYSPSIDDDNGEVGSGILMTGAIIGSTLGDSESPDDSEAEEYHHRRRSYDNDDDSGSSSSSGIDFGSGSSGGLDFGSFGGGDGGGGGASGDA